MVLYSLSFFSKTESGKQLEQHIELGVSAATATGSAIFTLPSIFELSVVLFSVSMFKGVGKRGHI
jgi:hypothetical protein